MQSDPDGESRVPPWQGHPPTADRLSRARVGRTWLPLLFLAGFGVALAVLSHVYLLPALREAQVASPKERERLAGGALLVLVVVMFVLVAGLLLTFRIGRFFFPRDVPRRKPTEYVDAWAESAKRMPTPPAESAEEGEE